MTFDLEQAVKDANKLVGCPLCKGIRYKRCLSCGEGVNSFGDFRDRSRTQIYETVREWREVNGTPEQDVPERKLQP
mgnify:CR=1 FL=1